MKITRTNKRIFSHSAVTAVPLSHGGPSREEQGMACIDTVESLVKDSERSETVY